MKSAAHALGPGDIDPSFPPIRVPPPPSLPDGPDCFVDFVIALPEGGFVLGCTSPNCLVRVVADGTVDKTFGVNGYAMIDPDPGTGYNPYVADIYPISGGLGDGYLVRLEMSAIAGGESIFYPALMRFTLDGRRDGSFGDDGYRAYRLPAEPSKSQVPSTRVERFWLESYGDLVMTDDGIFLLASIFQDVIVGPHRAYVLKIDRNGNYDTSFNGRGYMEPERNPGETWFAPYRLLLVEDKFIISGAFPGIGFIGRYDESGALDRQFGEGGRFADVGKYGYSFWHRMLLTADKGGIVCVGRSGATTFIKGRGVMVICKLDLNGQRDPDFHSGKTVLIEPGRTADSVMAPFDALLDMQRRIVVTGRVVASEGQRLTGFVARRLGDGSPDDLFGTEGVHELPELASVNRVIEQSDAGYVGVALQDLQSSVMRFVS